MGCTWLLRNKSLAHKKSMRACACVCEISNVATHRVATVFESAACLWKEEGFWRKNEDENLLYRSTKELVCFYYSSEYVQWVSFLVPSLFDGSFFGGSFFGGSFSRSLVVLSFLRGSFDRSFVEGFRAIKEPPRTTC